MVENSQSPASSPSILTEIQQHIRLHVRQLDPLEISEFNLNCIVGMTETGEATLEDVRAAGGDDLVIFVNFVKSKTVKD